MQHPISNVRSGDSAKSRAHPLNYQYNHSSATSPYSDTATFDYYRAAIQCMFSRTGEFQANIAHQDEAADSDIDLDEDSKDIPITNNTDELFSSPPYRSASHVLTSAPHWTSHGEPTSMHTVFPAESTQLMALSRYIPVSKAAQRTHAVEFYTSLLPPPRILSGLEGVAFAHTDARRQAYLVRDPWATNIRPFCVTCRGCGHDLKLRKDKQPNAKTYPGYRANIWIKHRNVCDGVYAKWCTMHGL